MFTGQSQHPYDQGKYVYHMPYRVKGVSERIRELRKQRGWSQGALAEMIRVSRPAVTQWENGDTKNLRADNLISLARAFGITVDELLTGQPLRIADTSPRYHASTKTRDEEVLLEKYRLLDKSDKNKLQAIASALDTDHDSKAQ